MKKSELFLFALLVDALIPLEAVCASLAYETIGEIASSLYWLALGFNLLFIIVALRSRTAAALGIVALALLIIPYQLLLADRLLRVQTEASRIVTYAYEQKLETGAYPANLAGYTFHDLRVEAYIQEYRLDDDRGGFRLAYYVGTPSTSHTFSPRYGWQYYPD